MVAKNPKVVIDLYQWLPSYGETRIELSMKALSLEVLVFFDAESGEERSKRIVFKGVASHFFSSVPGVELLKCTYEGVDASGALVEFEYSDAARLWHDCLPWRDKAVRHYQLFLLSENKRLEVFAQECGLEDN